MSSATGFGIRLFLIHLRRVPRWISSFLAASEIENLSSVNLCTMLFYMSRKKRTRTGASPGAPIRVNGIISQNVGWVDGLPLGFPTRRLLCGACPQLWTHFDASPLPFCCLLRLRRLALVLLLSRVLLERGHVRVTKHPDRLAEHA